MTTDSLHDNKSMTQGNGAERAWSATATFVIAGLVIVLCTYARVRLLGVPLERDEGEFAYFGQLILKGVPPFAVAYSMKLPGIYGMYALIMALFGQSPQGIHLGLLIANLLTILLIFLLGKRLCDIYAAAMASAVYALLSVSGSVVGIFAHATHFVVLFVMAGCFCLLEALDRENRLLLLVTGLLFGTAFLMKQHAALFIVFACMYLAVRSWKGRSSGRTFFMVGGTLFLAGTMIPYALTVCWMIKAGVFDGFWFWTVQYAREYTASEKLADGLPRLLSSTIDIIRPQFPLWLIATGAIGLLATKQACPRDRHFVFGLLLFSFLAICPGLFFREHYYIMVLPAVALLIGVALRSTASLPVLSQLGDLRRIIPLLLFTAAVAYGLASEGRYLFFLPPERMCREIYRSNPFPEAVEIARYIRSHTGSNDRIAVLGSEPEIYFYADRLSATGHIYMYGLMEEQPFAEQMQLQMISEIEKARPEYVVVVHVETSWLVRAASSQKILEWGENYVRNRYDLVGVVDMIDSTTTQYVWGTTASNYRPLSNLFLTVFKRSR